jgi:hypothetical protein
VPARSTTPQSTMGKTTVAFTTAAPKASVAAEFRCAHGSLLECVLSEMCRAIS